MAIAWTFIEEQLTGRIDTCKNICDVGCNAWDDPSSFFVSNKVTGKKRKKTTGVGGADKSSNGGIGEVEGSRVGEVVGVP